MSTFEGRGLGCVRGGRVVFTRLSFCLETGGALVLIGPNGSGKSSLLRMMARLSPAAAGRLLWDGAAVEAQAADHRRRLHYVGHLDAIKPALTARETLRLAAGLRGGGCDLERASTGALAAMGITRLGDIPSRYFSAGQRRRLALARLFAAPAPLWLLDEPRTALDADAVVRLDAAIADHRRGGGLVVVAMHGEPYPPAARILDVAACTPRPS
jgi:heme exporter protein A